MGSVGEVQPLAIHDVEVGLMQQRRSAERDAATTSAQLALGDCVELAVESGEQRSRSRGVPGVGGADEVADRGVQIRRPRSMAVEAVEADGWNRTYRAPEEASKTGPAQVEAIWDGGPGMRLTSARPGGGPGTL